MAARPLRQEHQAAARRHGRPAQRRLLRRPRARPGRAGDDVDADPAADGQHHGARTRTTPAPRLDATFTEAFYADPVRRYMLPVFSDRRTGLAVAPVLPAATRFTSTTCGRPRGSPTATPPRCWPRCSRRVRSTADTAPAWTWSATPRRPSRSCKLELKPVDRMQQHLDYLRATPIGARRRGLRRRRRQHAVEEPRGLRRPDPRRREHPRHPAGDQGGDGTAPALVLRRGARRGRAAGDEGVRPRCRPRGSHPREPCELGDPAGRHARRAACSRRASATSATRAC